MFREAKDPHDYFEANFDLLDCPNISDTSFSRDLENVSDNVKQPEKRMVESQSNKSNIKSTTDEDGRNSQSDSINTVVFGADKIDLSPPVASCTPSNIDTLNQASFVIDDSTTQSSIRFLASTYR